MPLYEYKCHKCGKVFEVMQKFSDAPLTTHDCGGEVERLLSAPALQFKGSGWYITDYAKGGSKPAGNTSNSDKSSSTSETKSDSTSSSSKSDSGSTGSSGSSGSGSGSSSTSGDKS